MEFSDTTNKDGIIQMIEKTTHLGDAAVSGSTSELAYFTQLINDWYLATDQWLKGVSRDWYFDDSNQTDFPYATTTIVDNQRDYTLPTDLRKLREVEILDTNGDYYALYPMSTESDVLKNERQQEEAGKPTVLQRPHHFNLGIVESQILNNWIRANWSHLHFLSTQNTVAM